MTTTIEARRLSGIDLGKTITLTDGDTGILRGVRHYATNSTLTLHSANLTGVAGVRPPGMHTIHLDPHETISITGRPSPKEQA